MDNRCWPDTAISAPEGGFKENECSMVVPHTTGVNAWAREKENDISMVVSHPAGVNAWAREKVLDESGLPRGDRAR
jgi:hypothetical protein